MPKAALEAMQDCLRLEMRKFGVKVLSIFCNCDRFILIFAP
jgi:NAD(P)-dependent dehydrogenase (short-subunit alcohol dehydrogenase family)